jgi:SpoVK/Ycf46/Vps4 family AAA+-type ATPase
VSSAAAVERLRGLRVSSDPMIFLYGRCVDDVFVGHDLVDRGIQETLWSILRSQGFTEIVFSSLRQPLYRLDGAAEAARGGGGMRFFRGPLGDRVMDRRPEPEQPAGGLSDHFAVMTMNHLMRRGGSRTAVVLTQAEEQLHYIADQRSLAGTVAEWLEYGTAPGNVCVLLFRRHTLEELRDFVRGLHGLPRLESFLAGPDAAFAVTEPDEGEAGRIIQQTRLRRGLAVGDWVALPAAARAMAQMPGVRARDWQYRLGELAAEGVALTGGELGRRRWIDSAGADGRSAWERLDRLVGLAGVRAHLDGLRWAIVAENELRTAGRSAATEPVSRHLVFRGPPGTGKTTVARLVGEMYRDLGVLRRGHVVEVQAKDLISPYVGDTPHRTDDVITSALDGVLFIDEAHQLADQNERRGGEAVGRLLTRMENDRDRLVVVAAGYPGRIERFLESDPGLSRRFPPGNIIDFPDLNPPELARVLFGALRDFGLTWTPEADARLVEVVTGLYETRDETFGNAGRMRLLADELRTSWAVRVRGAIDEPVTPEDLPAAYVGHLRRSVPPLEDLLSELDALVGLDEVKTVVRRLVDRIRLRGRTGAEAVAAPHLLFVGPPGTGKTTVARLVGRIFHAMGLLRRGHVVEVTRNDLVAEWIGRTGPRTEKAVREALDGVLFIDEAYALTRSDSSRDFGREAVDTLNREMERWRGRLTVIAAGYPDLMTEFVRRNPGLRSRFGEPVPFHSYDVPALVEILRRQTADGGYTLSAGAAARAGQWLAAARAKQGPEFGNGRTVRLLLEQMEARMAARIADDAPLVFDAEDVPDDHG